MIQTIKSVNFGSTKTGLATIGYALINSDGTEKQARTTIGIIEVSSTGIYIADLAFDDTWSGLILWDTGEGTPKYASENFDYRSYAPVSSGGGGSYATVSSTVREVDNKSFKKILKQLLEIKEILIGIREEKLGATLESIRNKYDLFSREVKRDLRFIREDISSVPLKLIVEQVAQSLENLAEFVETLEENKELEKQIEEVVDG
jgi:hypothetical protein